MNTYLQPYLIIITLWSYLLLFPLILDDGDFLVHLVILHTELVAMLTLSIKLFGICNKINFIHKIIYEGFQLLL